MATPTTTWAAIRDQMVSTILGIAPSTHSTVGFSFAPSKIEFGDFRRWAEQFDPVIFRFFWIGIDDTEVVGTSDLDVHLLRSGAEIVIAYPHQWANYGSDNLADLDDLMQQDINLVLKSVGMRGSSNYVSGQLEATETTWSPEQGNGVSFMTASLQVTYYVDAT